MCIGFGDAQTGGARPVLFVRVPVDLRVRGPVDWSPSTRSVSNLDIGTPGSRYRALRILGRGATSEVLLVYDAAEPDRPKAMKILAARVSPESAAAFREEFRMLST